MYDKELIFQRYPELRECRPAMEQALEILLECVKRGGKILLCGKEATATDVDAVRNWMRTNRPRVELFEIDGGQDIYPLIFILP